MYRSNNRGVTLLETAIAMGVLGVIAAGVWAGIDASRKAGVLELAIEQMVTLQHNVRSYYMVEANIPDGDVTAALVNGKSVPQEMIRSGTTMLDHPWGPPSSGGGVVITGGPVALYPFTFTLTYNDVPTHACINFVTKTTAGSSAQGLEAVTINSTSFTGTDIPVPPTTASPLCSASSTADVAFRYRLRLPTQ